MCVWGRIYESMCVFFFVFVCVCCQINVSTGQITSNEELLVTCKAAPSRWLNVCMTGEDWGGGG
jgi:hypothetical protein